MDLASSVVNIAALTVLVTAATQVLKLYLTGSTYAPLVALGVALVAIVVYGVSFEPLPFDRAKLFPYVVAWLQVAVSSMGTYEIASRALVGGKLLKKTARR